MIINNYNYLLIIIAILLSSFNEKDAITPKEVLCFLVIREMTFGVWNGLNVIVINYINIHTATGLYKCMGLTHRSYVSYWRTFCII